MVDHSVTTQFDLAEQVLAGQDGFELKVSDPDVSIEEQVVNELVRRKETGLIGVSYANTTVPVIAGRASECVPQWNEFFLLSTLETNGFAFERFAHVYAQGGFTGIHFAKQAKTAAIYFVDTTKDLAKLAMRWYGYDAEKDQNVLTGRARPLGDGWRVDHKGTEMYFVAQSLETAVKEDKKVSDFVTCMQYVPGVSQGPPAFEVCAEEARKRSGQVFFSYSSLCDDLVRRVAKGLGAGRHVLASREKPLVMDSNKGPMIITRKDLVEKWKPLGLIDYGKNQAYQYGHEWRVGLLTWK